MIQKETGLKKISKKPAKMVYIGLNIIHVFLNVSYL